MARWTGEVRIPSTIDGAGCQRGTNCANGREHPHNLAIYSTSRALEIFRALSLGYVWVGRLFRLWLIRKVCTNVEEIQRSQRSNNNTSTSHSTTSTNHSQHHSPVPLPPTTTNMAITRPKTHTSPDPSKKRLKHLRAAPNQNIYTIFRDTFDLDGQRHSKRVSSHATFEQAKLALLANCTNEFERYVDWDVKFVCPQSGETVDEYCASMLFTKKGAEEMVEVGVRGVV